MSNFEKIKNALLGKAKSPKDKGVFHNLSLIAFFAWVGLGADGLSSSCYGPEEAFLALQGHTYLSLFVALATALTVLIISTSYSQLIELFPTGGGGYLVASKLLSPNLGMIAGCALLIDYVLTISISIASGADALFSFLPVEWHAYRLYFAMAGVMGLTLMNMRGVKEAVLPLVPIFLTFLVTHFFVIVYGLIIHWLDFPELWHATGNDFTAAKVELGAGGIIFLLLRAYSMGAGTYTGIEAVSNGMSILREPRVLTAKKTMRYMSWSLAFMVLGLMIAYLVFQVSDEPGKTLNAVLFQNVTETWPAPWGQIFVLVTLVSEAMLLFIAAQAGFVGGPGVLANMALDRWFPTKFSSLSDRLVAQNGVLLMGLAALATLVFTHGSVHILVVLYSINVFITFCFSQAGMVRHWLQVRDRVKVWKKKIFINGIGLILTSFILVSVIVLKFNQGGWITLVITGALIFLAATIKRHYLNTAKLLHRLNSLVQTASAAIPVNGTVPKIPAYNPNAKTAVLLVNGFNGLGLHTLFNVIRFFGNEFKNFVFIQVGVIDVGNFKGVEEVDRLTEQSSREVERYVAFMRSNGYFTEGFSVIGTDVIDEIERISADVLKRYPESVFFGGQLVFPKESIWTRWLHNYTVFAMQRRFYQRGIPFVILPIRV